jgi:hypothetical protein
MSTAVINETLSETFRVVLLSPCSGKRLLPKLFSFLKLLGKSDTKDKKSRECERKTITYADFNFCILYHVRLHIFGLTFMLKS